MTSLRGRLTVWLVGMTAALTVCAGTWLYLYVRHEVVHEFDIALAAKAHAIGSLLRLQPDGRYEFDFADDSMPEYLPGRKPEFFQIVGPDHTTLERSVSLAGADLVPPSSAVPHEHPWDLSLPDGLLGRAITYRAIPHPEEDDRDAVRHVPPHQTAAAPPVLVIVARDRSALDRMLAALATALGGAGLVLAAASVLAVRFAVTRGLRPVSELADRTTTIGPDTLDRRFDVAALPDELRPIGQRLNDLLERLEQGFRRERRLNADIAHELRTPIAELRSLTEVATRWPTDAAQSAQYLRDAHDVALRMESVVETLLLLARSQAQRTAAAAAGSREAFPLAGLVGEVLSAVRGQVAARALAVRVDVPDGLHVWVDRVMFRRIMENLLVNAAYYAPEGGRIECAAVVAAAGGGCTLTIANTSDVLAADDLPKMFEPFWRKDPARSDDAHAGLGLALVAEYARQLGIRLTPRLVGGNWFEMRLDLPTAADATAGGAQVPVEDHDPVMYERVH